MVVPSIALNDGHSMPQLGLGTWKAGPGEVGQAVAVAIDLGYRHIDCAAIYLNEKEVGSAIQSRIERGTVKREDVFVVSKLWSTKHHPEDVEAACVESLRDLKVDYLDLYLMHSPVALRRGSELFPRGEDGKLLFEHDTSLEKTWTAMEKLVAKGLVRSIGVSNFNSKQIQRIVDVCKIRPVTNQVEVNPLLHQDPLFNFCRRLSITVTAYTPIGTSQVFSKNASGENVPKVLEEPRLVTLAQKYKRTTAQIIIRWLIQRGLVVLAKSTRAERLRENLDVFDFSLSEQDMQTILAIGVANKTKGFFLSKDTEAHPEFPYSDDPDFF